MLTCECCEKNIEFHEAVFIGDSVTCLGCKPSDSGSIGGMPSSVFGIFAEAFITYDNPKSGYADVMDNFMASEGVFNFHRQYAEGCFDLFREFDLDKTKLDVISELIPSAMFLINLGQDEVRHMLKTKNENLDDETLDFIFKLI